MRRFLEWLEDFLASPDIRSIGLAFVTAYASVIALSVVIAHVLFIVNPSSGLGQRFILPVTRGLSFLDTHWKSVLIAVFLPVVAPMARELILRITEVGGIKLLPLDPVGVRDKPNKVSAGGTQ